MQINTYNIYFMEKYFNCKIYTGNIFIYLYELKLKTTLDSGQFQDSWEEGKNIS